MRVKFESRWTRGHQVNGDLQGVGERRSASKHGARTEFVWLVPSLGVGYRFSAKSYAEVIFTRFHSAVVFTPG